MQNSIANIWTAMEGEKGDLVSRCKQYASWTIPGVCPEDNSEQAAALTSYVVIGPRLINNLSNKIVEAMYPHTRPFFSVNLNMEVQKKIRIEAGDEALAEIAGTSRKEARWIEEYGVSKMNLVKYRPRAVDAAQQLLVCGNALIRRMPNGNRVVYGVKDFGIRRAIDGEALEIVLRDWVSDEELPQQAVKQLEKIRPREDGKVIGKTSMTTVRKPYELFTRFYKDNTRWLQEQEVEGILLDNKRGYAERDFPCIPLAWSLPRGHNYARGLVEEHANVFHNLNVTGEALFDIFQISADIKFIINPASLLDIVELNNSKRGSYHLGNPDDLQTLSNDKAKELGVLLQAVQGMERELSLVFLMGSGAVRDAERVTAYEVQFNALELEQAFGGLYSRLALDWQQKEAEYLVGTLRIPSLDKKDLFDITITTGMESLSREGALQNFRASIMDLQLLNEVPEQFQGTMNPLKVATFLFQQRGVKLEEFMYTQAEMQANQEAAQAQETEMINREAAAKAATTQTPEEQP